MYDQFMELAGVDITREPMEVGPTCHYLMGGVSVDGETGASRVPGLFATGECTGGMNGANRLGGNSLATCSCSASAPVTEPRRPRPRRRRRRLTTRSVADAAGELLRYLDGGPGHEDPYELHADLQATMQIRRRHLP